MNIVYNGANKECKLQVARKIAPKSKTQLQLDRHFPMSMIPLVQRKSNPCRIPTVLFGAFGLIALALRQQGGVLCDQNPINIPRWNVLRSFFGADFRPDAASTEENPLWLVEVNNNVWAEIRPIKTDRGSTSVGQTREEERPYGIW